MEAARRLADMYDLDLNRAMREVLAMLRLSANKGAVAAIRSALLIEQTLKRRRIDEIMRAWPLPKSAFA